MSKCIKCGRELTSAEIPEFYNGMCEKCCKEQNCAEYPFKQGIYDYQQQIDQLKQQLAEKDEQIKKRVMVYEKQFIEQTDEIYSLKQQLAEKQNTIDEINKEFVQAVHDWKALYAEKDNEIEHLKEMDNYHLLYELAGADETIANLKKQLEEKDKDKTQLAIQELEKVKTLIQNAISFEKPNFVEVYDVINKQIKELSNNTFKCEICGEITPKNCEGGEPNVCAGCVPVETHDLRLHIEPQSHENDFLD